MMKQAEESQNMKSDTELILTAAAAASVTLNGSPRRFTLRDVKRELKPLCASSEAQQRYRVSQGGASIATGHRISQILKTLPELYTPIYHKQPSALSCRIVAFQPVNQSLTAEGGEA